MPGMAVRRLICAILTTVSVGAIRASGANVTLLRGPYLQSMNASGVTVCWRSDQAYTGAVYYGLSEGALTQVQTEADSAVDHAVRLNGLLPDTTYYYSVRAGAQVLSGGADVYFQTAPETGSMAPQRIWLLGDSGLANFSAQWVLDAYGEYNGAQYTDLLLTLGDAAYPDGTDADYQAAVFDMFPDVLRQTPWFSTYSNHDAHSSDSATQSGPYYDIVELPTAGECGGVPSGTEAYNSFDFGNIHFINLDMMESPRGTNGAMHLWLEQDLAANSSDWTVVYTHHPPYTKGSHDSDTEIALIEIRENFLPLLEQYGVDLLIAGHSHNYERSMLLRGHYGNSSEFNESVHVLDSGDGREEGDGIYTKAIFGSRAGWGTVYMVAGSSASVGGTEADYPHPVTAVNRQRLGSVILDVAGNRLDVTFLEASGSIGDRFAIQKLDYGAEDRDDDGLPDEWEQTFFGNPTNAVAGQDPDRDGLDNWDEYIAGTSPSDESSRFVLETEMLANGNLRVRWPSARHRVYSLYGCVDMVPNRWRKQGEDIPGTGSTHEVELILYWASGFLKGQVDYP